MSFVDDLKVLTGKTDVSKPQVPEMKKKILVVEDDKALIKVLTERLAEEGFDTIQAANGQEGLQLAQSENPDVILLDLMMPVMDGKSMLHRLRETPKEQEKRTPVIVLTNAGEVDNIRDTMRYHDAIDFLIKSNVSMDTIITKIKSVAW